MEGWTEEQSLPSTPQAPTLPVPAPQAFQAAIDQIEKRNETFKAAAQGPEGDTQEQEVNEAFFIPCWSHQPKQSLFPLCSAYTSSEGEGVSSARRD